MHWSPKHEDPTSQERRGNGDTAKIAGENPVERAAWLAVERAVRPAVGADAHPGWRAGLLTAAELPGAGHRQPPGPVRFQHYCPGRRSRRGQRAAERVKGEWPRRNKW